MAVFVVSLRDVARLRKHRPNPAPAPVSDAPVADKPRPVEANVRSAAADPPAAEARPVQTDQEDRQPPIEWLTLSREQIEAILASSEGPDKKAILALLYRLAALESEMADIRRQLSHDRPATPRTPLMPAPVAAVSVPASKLDLLEEIFRRNLRLRKTP